jgi:putative endopeptidase
MDTDTIQQLGAQPVQPWLKAVDKITDHATLMQALVQFAIADINVFWSWWVDADSEDSSIYSFFVAQGGISMPDQTYYTEQTEEMEGHRAAYRKLIKDIMMLSGRTEHEAQQDADNTLELETAVAKSMTPRAEERDEHGSRMTLTELQTISPSIDWAFFFAGVGAPRVGMPPPNSGGFLVVKNEKFFRKLDAIISDIGLDKIKSYLRWQAVYNYAPFLDFNFEHKLLGAWRGSAVPNERARTYMCVC